MTASGDAIAIAQAGERLRQQQELFDQRKRQDARTFRLKLVMGWVAVGLLIAICAFAGYIIINNGDFSTATVTAATSALLVEALGLTMTIFRGTLGDGPAKLEPTTEAPAMLPQTSGAEDL